MTKNSKKKPTGEKPENKDNAQGKQGYSQEERTEQKGSSGWKRYQGNRE